MISWRVPALLLVIGTATLAACAVTGTSPWLPSARRWGWSCCSSGWTS